MPRVNNEPKLNKRPKKFNRSKVPKSQAYKVTQDNRLVYSKFENLSVSELKFFYYVISKLNPISDKNFEVREIPINEILGEVLEHENLENNYTYVSKLIDRLAGRFIKDETIINDPITNKDVRNKKGMPIFRQIQYTEGQAIIKYQLNDCLSPYLLGLKEKFLTYKFENILPMTSSYAIRIYQMLLSERNQNKTKLEMPLIQLQDILCVPKSMYVWDNFKRRVLEPSLEEINQHTELVVMVDPKKLTKEGKKIIGITFEFDYKDKEQRKEQNKKKAIHQLGVRIVKPLEKLKGKTLDYMVNGETKEITYCGNFTINEDRQEVIAVFEEMPQRNRYTLTLKTPEDIEKLKTMQKQHTYRRISKNKKLILADKDGSGLVFSQQIQENSKKRKEEEKPTPIENKPTQKAINQEAPTHKIFDKAFREANKSVNSMTKDLGNLFEQHLTKKDPPNQ